MEQCDGDCKPKPRCIGGDRFSRHLNNARKKQRYRQDYQQRA